MCLSLAVSVLCNFDCYLLAYLFAASHAVVAICFVHYQRLLFLLAAEKVHGRLGESKHLFVAFRTGIPTSDSSRREKNRKRAESGE